MSSTDRLVPRETQATYFSSIAGTNVSCVKPGSLLWHSEPWYIIPKGHKVCAWGGDGGWCQHLQKGVQKWWAAPEGIWPLHQLWKQVLVPSCGSAGLYPWNLSKSLFQTFAHSPLEPPYTHSNLQQGVYSSATHCMRTHLLWLSISHHHHCWHPALVWAVTLTPYWHLGFSNLSGVLPQHLKPHSAFTHLPRVHIQGVYKRAGDDLASWQCFFPSLDSLLLAQKKKKKKIVKYKFSMPKFPGAQCPVARTLNKQPTNMTMGLCSASWKPQVTLHLDTTVTKSSGEGDVQLSKALQGSAFISKRIPKETWIFFNGISGLFGAFFFFFSLPRNILNEKVSVHASDSAQLSICDSLPLSMPVVPGDLCDVESLPPPKQP